MHALCPLSFLVFFLETGIRKRSCSTKSTKTGVCSYKSNPYCFKCGQSFKTSVHFKRHKLGERPRACPECRKRFITSSELKVHLRVHSGEKPYHCSECGKSFTQSGSFSNHCRRHRNEKHHHCPECNKHFQQLIDL